MVLPIVLHRLLIACIASLFTHCRCSREPRTLPKELEKHFVSGERKKSGSSRPRYYKFRVWTVGHGWRIVPARTPSPITFRWISWACWWVPMFYILILLAMYSVVNWLVSSLSQLTYRAQEQDVWQRWDVQCVLKARDQHTGRGKPCGIEAFWVISKSQSYPITVQSYQSRSSTWCQTGLRHMEEYLDFASCF